MTDFEALLRKYMSHVVDMEGVYFLPDLCDGFDAAECAELERLCEEANANYMDARRTTI